MRKTISEARMEFEPTCRDIFGKAWEAATSVESAITNAGSIDDGINDNIKAATNHANSPHNKEGKQRNRMHA
jgi:hypothetical protein